MVVHNPQHRATANVPTVFISGSRSIKRLPLAVAQRLAVITRRRMPILIGDAGGVDLAAQRFLADQDMRDVTVFCAGATPRNNLGHWPIEQVPVDAPKGTAAFHAGKDREMARRAGAGFVIWDGRSRGSLANIHRLCVRGCFVVIYVAQNGKFITLHSDGNREDFLIRHPVRSL